MFPRHWGFAFNVFLGSGLTLGIAWRLDLIRDKYAWIILVYEIVIVLFGVVIAKFHLFLHNKLKSVTIDSERDDRPIRTLDKNLIPEFENVAQRILGHLLLSTEDDNHGPNVALIGPFGSGKTSLCNLIECIYNNPSDDQKKLKIIFCRFEAWQYLTADAAVRGLLDQIVGQIKEHVDSMQLATIPDKYLEALGACPHWFLNMLSILLKRKPIPEEVVCSLQNILLRINRKVVVFVDDLDRLESRSIKAQDAVSAALNQLQNLTSVQYVLCVGPSMTTDTDKTPRKANYDLLKSTRFQELVPDMPSEDILNKIRALRDEAISLDENMYYVWNEKESDDPFKYNPMLEHYNSNIASQAIKLIQTPRQLKTVERETREKWKNLKGEISWYDLVMINTIKSCESPVFEWIINEKNQFLEGPLAFKDINDEKKKELRDSIEGILKGRISIKT
ncbi:AAA family ATPase, partial [bacterium]|nr:AAA family ATPase [bacterium]